jgi:hypothetical protein
MGCWCLLQSVARGVQQVLVCWKGEPISAATWEDLDDFIAKYSSFQLEDELVVEGGGRCHVGSPLHPKTVRQGRSTGCRACRVLVQRPGRKPGTYYWLE